MTTIKNEAGALVLMGKDAIKADQDVIRSNLVNLDLSIHSNAVQCLMHAQKHGDASLMQRLLIDIIDDKSGYRRQGLIGWMRAFSPLELNGKTVNLQGVDEKGVKRAWKIEEANNTPFRTAPAFKEMVKPVFKDTLMAKFESGIREWEACASNTLDGKPIDPSKPFFDGLHTGKIAEFVEMVKAAKAELPADETRVVRLTQSRIEKDTQFVEDNKDNVNARHAA